MGSRHMSSWRRARKPAVMIKGQKNKTWAPKAGRQTTNHDAHNCG